MNTKKPLPSKAHKVLKLGVFSFFSGAGLLDLAFEDSGFDTLAMNEPVPSIGFWNLKEKFGWKKELSRHGLSDIQ